MTELANKQAHHTPTTQNFPTTNNTEKTCNKTRPETKQQAFVTSNYAAIEYPSTAGLYFSRREFKKPIASDL
jgi:hypothetical protein